MKCLAQSAFLPLISGVIFSEIKGERVMFKQFVQVTILGAIFFGDSLHFIGL